MHISVKIFNANGLMYNLTISVYGTLQPHQAFVATAKQMLTFFCYSFVFNWISIEITHTVLRIYVVDKSSEIHRD